MLDLGFTELLLIGIVALIVVGPKDLPGLFRNVGKFVGKAKGMAREFSSAMNAAADESGIKDAASGLSDLKNMANPGKMGLDSIGDSIKEATNEFTKWTPTDENEGAASESGLTVDQAEDRAVTAKKTRSTAAKKIAERKAVEAATRKKKTAAKAKPKPAAKPKATAKPKPAKRKTPAAKAPKAPKAAKSKE